MMLSKIESLKKEMTSKGIDYVIIGPTSNLVYLLGIETEQMERLTLLIISSEDGKPTLIVPKLLEEQIIKNLILKEIEVISYLDNEDAYEKNSIRENSVIAFDDNLYSRFAINIINKFKPKKITLASDILDTLRMRKSEEELNIIREAIKISIKSFYCFINRIDKKMPERVMANLLKECIVENGADRPSFEPIITSGPNTSMPHLNYTDRIPKDNEPIIVDFGVKYMGYSTDMTRILSFGSLNKDASSIYYIVKEAQETSENLARKGMRAGDLDNIARNIISTKGYGEYFIHRLGHGIGIDVHERPYISQGSNEYLDSGMVFTIEPGIYLPSRFGIRLEDMVVINADGKAEILTKDLPKEVFSL